MGATKRPYNTRLALRRVFLPRRHFHEYFLSRVPSSQSPDQTTTVRIPIRSATHHFGAGVSRGSRPYNEDTYQAGTVNIPAFAQRQRSTTSRSDPTTSEGAQGESGDPQVFYFGIFDGHGGRECSEFLKERLHGYIEEAAALFDLQSSIDPEGTQIPGGVMGAQDPVDLQKSLADAWREMVGGYFRRFKPANLPAVSAGEDSTPSTPETVLTYAFLKADLDFISAQAAKRPSSSSSHSDAVRDDKPLNEGDVLFHPERPASQNLTRIGARPSSSPDLNAPIGGSSRFLGGSTASIALISTPTNLPFWSPTAQSTLLIAHVGDTRILLCRVSDGAAVPLTTNHHPSAPAESERLRRFARAFVTDSFGEERIDGLANTRAFGDIASKRLGVSAEAETTRVELRPAEYAFMVLTSDGVCGHLSDREIVDLVKEAKTPHEAGTRLVAFATETASSADADNATALVVRLGGWERRNENGGGSLKTLEQREFRLREAEDPRRGRR